MAWDGWGVWEVEPAQLLSPLSLAKTANLQRRPYVAEH